MSSATWATKDPSEVVVYTFNWSGILPMYDYIITSTWSVTSGSGLVLDTTHAGIAEPVTSIPVSSGTNGITYTIKNTVVTAKGRTYIKTASLVVADK